MNTQQLECFTTLAKTELLPSKNSVIYKFIGLAKDCAATALPCSKKN